MATTENLYTGDGSTVLYSFTFPYIETAHIKVSVDAVDTTAYTLANATTVQFEAAPANGAAIRIYRSTPNDVIEATFFPGSSIRAQDLNDNFTQTLYVSQEVRNNSVQITGDYTLSGEFTFIQPVNGPLPVDPNDYATKAYIDALAINGVSDGDKGDITVSGGGLVWTVTGGYLKPADIGTTVQAYDANLATIPTGSTILVDGDVGSTVQGYDADTAKTDLVQSYTAAQRGSVVALTSGINISVDLSLGNNFSLTLDTNGTLDAPSNITAGQHGIITITQDGTGSRTLAYASIYKFPGGVAPALSVPANAVDQLVYYVEDANRITCSLISDLR